jgi:DNA-directed RNA polymerase subunit RPC12/RpoP
MSEQNIWEPKENYIETPSLVEGIRVWRPKPTKDNKAVEFTYNCPNCGAPTQFDLVSSGLSCQFCGFKSKIFSHQVGKQALELEFRKDLISGSLRDWHINRKHLFCENCGAELEIEANDLSTTCPFCTSNKINFRKAPLPEFEPQALIPFKKTEEEITANIIQWIGKGWFHPGDLQKSFSLKKLSALYIPVWTFDTNIDSSWDALVGYERQKRYYDSGSKSWKSRTVIDWKRENGIQSRFFDDFLVSASIHTDAVLFQSIQPFNLNQLVAFNAEFLIGWKAHNYTKYLKDGWTEARNLLRDKMRKVCLESIHSPHIRNFSMEADFNDETWRYILVPVYLVSFQYSNNIFQILVNAQTGKVAGQKPVDWTKVWLAILGLFAPGLIFTLLGIIFLLIGGVGIFAIIIGALLFIVGGIVSYRIFNSAKQAEEGTS